MFILGREIWIITNNFKKSLLPEKEIYNLYSSQQYYGNDTKEGEMDGKYGIQSTDEEHKKI